MYIFFDNIGPVAFDVKIIKRGYENINSVGKPNNIIIYFSLLLIILVDFVPLILFFFGTFLRFLINYLILIM